MLIYSLNFLIFSDLRVEALQLFGDVVSQSKFILYLSWSCLVGGISIWIGLNLKKQNSILRRAAYLTIPGLFNPGRMLILYHAGLLLFLGDASIPAFASPISATVKLLIFGLAVLDGLVLVPLSSVALFRIQSAIKQRQPNLAQSLNQTENWNFL